MLSVCSLVWIPLRDPLYGLHVKTVGHFWGEFQWSCCFWHGVIYFSVVWEKKRRYLVFGVFFLPFVYRLWGNRFFFFFLKVLQSTGKHFFRSTEILHLKKLSNLGWIHSHNLEHSVKEKKGSCWHCPPSNEFFWSILQYCKWHLCPTSC